MQKVKRTLVIARPIKINCKANDAVDMRCGGPPFLGLDFYVDIDDESIKAWLKKALKKHGHPVMSITLGDEIEIAPKNLWSRQKIEGCLKETVL